MTYHLVFAEKSRRRTGTLPYVPLDPESFAIIKGTDPDKHFLAEVESADEAARLGHALRRQYCWSVFVTDRGPIVVPTAAVSEEVKEILRLGHAVGETMSFAHGFSLKGACCAGTFADYAEAESLKQELAAG